MRTNTEPLVTRPLLVRFVSTVGSATSFYLLLSAVPEYVRSAGADAGTAGLATTALTLSSVAAYLATPRLTARYGYRMTLAVGLAALGAPALVLALSANIAVIMAVCVVRGAGFALVCVAGGALTVSLIPPGRRGEGLALVGVVGGVPSVACLPLGVWLAGHVGYRPVFLAGGAAALAGLASVPWLPRLGRRPGQSGQRSGPVRSGPEGSGPEGSGPEGSGPEGSGPVRSGLPRSGRQQSGPGGAGPAAGILAGLRSPALMRPAVTFAAVTMGIGIVVTFLPLALPRATGVAALALLIQPATAIGGRWVAGRYGDRHGSAVLLAPGVLVAAAGLATLSVTAVPAAVIAGGAVFGVGVGVTQNASQTLMYSRVPESGYGTAGAIWNLAYDGGMGLGTAWFGLAAARAGYPAAFALTAAVLPVVLAVLAAAGRWGRRTSESAAGRRGGRTRERAAGLGHEMLEPEPGARTTSRSV
jgi:predicted MFS family arabinose efflux permease